MSDETRAGPRGLFWYWRGRAGRAEYWVLVAVLFALSLALGHIPAISLGLAFSLLIAQVRRVHDFGRTGWWAAASTVVPTLIGIGVFLTTRDEDVAILVASPIQLGAVVVIGAIAGDKAINRFGAVPAFTVRRVLTGR